MIKVLVFDMDGTLIDSDDVIMETWHELFRLYKPKDYFLDDKIVRTFSGPPLDKTLKKVFPELDQKFILKEYSERTRKYYDTCLKPFPNVEETLLKFKKDGYKLAILTSKNREMTLYSLKNVGLDQNIFDLIIGADEVTHHKPNPEGINRIMSNFGVKPNEVINIGDTEFDYGSGENAGVNTIMMTMKERNYESKIVPLSFCSSYNDLYKEIKEYDHK